MSHSGVDSRVVASQDTIIDESFDGYVSPGMPPLEKRQKSLSFFEFWPSWLIYLPVCIQWIFLSIRYRSLTLPFIANPELPLSGMVGVPKSALLSQATGNCQKAILSWLLYDINEKEITIQLRALKQQLDKEGFQFPLVAKPDIGCRGSGVKLIHDESQLKAYMTCYPEGTSIMLQELAHHEPEAGVFFIKEPNQQTGQIVSLALKYMPYVVGNGRDTLKQLISHEERASQLLHLYLERHKAHLDKVIPKGEPYRLVFSASHSRGAIFRNAEELITPELTEYMNHLLSEIPEFYYGRLDIKFKDIQSLKRGETIEIIEINTASSESLHIWDSETSYFEANRALLYQYRMLFKLGHQNRQRGYKPPKLRTFISHLKKEFLLKKFYPTTD